MQELFKEHPKSSSPPPELAYSSTDSRTSGISLSHRRQSLVREGLPFALWIVRNIVVFASFVCFTTLLSNAFCDILNDGSDRHYCSSWHRVAATIHDTTNWLSLSISEPSPIACHTSLCFDENVGARILSDEITHLTNILNLLDGCGRRFGAIFDPDRHIRDAAYATQADMDSGSVGFMTDAKTFLRQTRLLDIMFPRVAWKIAERFRDAFNLDIHLRIALDQLHSVQSMRQAISSQDLSIQQRQINAVKVDDMVHTTITNLIGNLSLDLGLLLPEIQNATLLSESIGPVGAQVRVGLDNEPPRLRQILKTLPWWETWKLVRLWRYTMTEKYEFYLQFLELEGPALRSFAEDAQIFMENIQALTGYCAWYAKRQSTDLDDFMQDSLSKRESPLLDDIAFAIDQLNSLGDSIQDDALHKLSESLPRRPHRPRAVALPLPSASTQRS